MSNKIRPMKWFPIEYNSDPIVQALSPFADLLYRRALDLLWQSKDGQFPNVLQKVYNAIGRGLSQDEFSSAWLELQHDGFEALSVSKCGQWLYSKRLKADMRKSAQCAAAGRKGGLKKKGGDTLKKPRAALPGTHDEKGTIAIDPGKRSTVQGKGGFFEQIRQMNSESTLSKAAQDRLKR